MKYYLALILLIAITACSSGETPQPELVSEAEVNITGISSLQIGQNLEVSITSDKVIRIPQATYYTPAGPWQVFKKQGNDWIEVEFLKNCYNTCGTVCEEEKYCAPGGPYPGCSRLTEKETNFKWDLRQLTDSQTMCGLGEKSCKELEFIDIGEYKVVFNYRDTCAMGVSWTLEDGPIYSKEFYFEVRE